MDHPEAEVDDLRKKVQEIERRLDKVKRKKRKRSRSRSRRRRRQHGGRRSRSPSPEPEPKRRRARRHRRYYSSDSDEDKENSPVLLLSSPVPLPDVPLDATQVASQEGGSMAGTLQPQDDQEKITPPEILEILGATPETNEKFGKAINKDVALRLEHICTNGLSKEERKLLTEKYLIPENSKLTAAPSLNTEIKAAVTEVTSKRDKAIEIRQRQLSAAISGVGNAITSLISSNKEPEVLRILMEAARLLCDNQYNDTTTRRNFILSTVKKDLKDQLQATKPDSFLFGDNFSETLKNAKTINKSAADLRPGPAKNTYAQSKSFNNNSKQNNLNYRGPHPPPISQPPAAQRRTQPGSHQRTRKTVRQPQTSYRTSQNQRRSYNHQRR